MQRRQFLQTTGAISLAALISQRLQALAPDHPYFKTLGLQLWTVRNQMQADASKTLQAIAKAGYYQVELMDVLKDVTVAKMARDVGLQVTSAFFDWNSIVNPQVSGTPTVAQCVDAAHQLGLRHLVFGYIGKGSRETADQFKRIADAANQAADRCRQAEIQLCYHNHSFEFKSLPSGEKGYEIFIDRFDRQTMKFEVDVFWIAIGGWDPVQTIQRLTGRVSQVHLKDLLAGTATNVDESTVAPEAFKELGQGTLDLPAVIRAAQQAGAQQCHVEQDQSPAPLESIVTSIDYLRTHG